MHTQISSRYITSAIISVITAAIAITTLSFSLTARAESLFQTRVVSPTPTLIQDGAVISLACDRIYSGTLPLAGKRGVVVRPATGCKTAMITPAVPITGWSKQGAIWSAAINFEPRMVQVGATFAALAHEPNDRQAWYVGEGKGRDTVRVQEFNHDLRGATIVWRAEDWLILAQSIADNDRGLLRISQLPDEDFKFPAKTAFYLEGQRWMLNSPGEWIYHQGRLLIWPEDGLSPEGRTWALSRGVGIDAHASSGIRIEGITIFLATQGIDGSEARDLAIVDTHIMHSEEDAIVIGGAGTRISRIKVDGTVQNGLRATDDATDVRIEDSVIRDTGMLGMPKRSKGAIVFEQARGHVIERNTIQRAGYLGIRVFRDAVVDRNYIDQVCLRMTDCGGIYTAARDRLPLRTRIENNRISNVQGRWSYAIYLDDFANGVVVNKNQAIANSSGMQLHDGFANLISGNLFKDSAYQHILFNETSRSSVLYGNQLSGNQFDSLPGVPVFRLWSGRGGEHLSRFASFTHNRYAGNPDQFAQLEGTGIVSRDEWVKRMGDANPEFISTGSLPQLPGKR
jgi:hypothetical protein